MLHALIPKWNDQEANWIQPWWQGTLVSWLWTRVNWTELNWSELAKWSQVRWGFSISATQAHPTLDWNALYVSHLTSLPPEVHFNTTMQHTALIKLENKTKIIFIKRLVCVDPNSRKQPTAATTNPSFLFFLFFRFFSFNLLLHGSEILVEDELWGRCPSCEIADARLHTLDDWKLYFE